MRLIAFLLSLMLWIPSPSNALSLKVLSEKAVSLPENPPMDNDDPIDPDFTTYFKSLKPNPWKRLVDVFKSDPSLQVRKDLEKSISQTLLDLKKSKDPVVIPVTAKSRIIVIGDVHGTYHSMLRICGELVGRGMMDDSLKLKDSNTHMIFMGNIIDRSAHSSETLMLIFELLHQNPDQVIYMRGSHENKGNWLNYDFPRELKDRLGYQENDPIFYQLNRLFERLPSRVHLRQTDGEILCLNSLYGLDYMAQTKENPTIAIFINAQSRSRVYQTTRGFDMLPFESGLPTWTAFSSPSQSFQKMFNFYWDSAVIIDPDTSWHRSKALVLRHNVHNNKLVFEETIRHLMSGRELKKGEEYESAWLDLSIGCPLDFTEGSKILGERLRAGIDLRVRKLNREGGLNGKLLRVYFVDDMYSPSKTLQITDDLYNRTKTNLIMTTLGSATTQALMPLVQSAKILLMFPYTGDNSFRHEKYRNMIHFRPSYLDEISALVRYSQEKMMSQKYAVFYTDEPFGRERFEFLKNQVMEKYKIAEDQICPIPYPRGTINVDKAVPELKACNPDALVLLSTFDAARALVQGVGVSNLKNTNLMGYSYLTDLFQDFVGQGRDGHSGKGLNFSITRLIPNPQKNTLEIVQDYRRELSLVYPGSRVDVDSLEGYVNASILIDIIAHIPEPITLDKIIAKAEEMHGYDFKGLKLNFDPVTRELSRQVWIDPGHGDWIPMSNGQEVSAQEIQK